jgi:hypothetical protein
MAPDQPEPNPTPVKEKPVVPQKKAANLRDAPSAIAGFLLEVIVPSFVALALLYFLSGTVNLWALDRNLAVVIAIVFLVVVCLILCYAIDAFLRGIQRTPPATGKKRAAQYRTRLIKFVLGGMIIPLGLMAAANFSVLPTGGSLMDYYIRMIQTRLTTTPTSQLGDAILSSDNPATKIQGIKALEAIHTTDALDQLLRVLSSDPGALKDAGEYEALSRAVASYGVDAKLKLLDIFTKLPPDKSETPTLGGEDLYTRYFSLPAEALRSEINSQTTDSASRQAQLSKMDALIATMKTSLTGIQNPATGADFTAQDFVLDAMMQMSMNSDADLKNFASKTAVNSAYSDDVRGKAILLIARFGEKGDMGLLYPFLASNNDDFLKAKALEGITDLQMKISGSTSATATP